MKTLITFLLGIAAGGFGVYFYMIRPPEAPATAQVATPDSPAGDTPANDSDTARRTDRPAADLDFTRAREFADLIGERLERWNLTAEDIRRELELTGRIVREGLEQIGGRVVDTATDFRIIAEINSRFAFDSDLSARDIVVESAKGVVTLRGTVPAVDLIGKAVMIAMETRGVVNVISKLRVQDEDPV
jgi:hypothetical protein